MTKEKPPTNVSITPAPEFVEPEATAPVAIRYTVRDPNTGELKRSADEFKKVEENENAANS